MTTREEIEKQLAAAREAIGVRLGDALERRDEAIAEIKVLRAELDALPKLAVKRTRKAKVVEPVLSRTHQQVLDAEQECET